MCEGFITLQRRLLNWEWVDDPNTLAVWIHILLSANWQDNKWHGMTIPRGTALLSYNKLAMQAGMSVRNVRTAIEHLKSTGEITYEATRYGLLINVINYSKYQDFSSAGDKPTDTQPDTDVTGKRQGTDTEPTTLEQRNKETNIKERASKDAPKKRKTFVKPTVDEVSAYIKEHGYTVNAERFVGYYESNGWKVGRNPMIDWKAAVRTWQSKEFPKPKGKEMPEYTGKTSEAADVADLAAVRAMQERMKHDRS